LRARQVGQAKDMKKWIKIRGRQRRHKIIRKNIAGTKEKPRLSVYRSLSSLYAQLIDDDSGKTLLSLATSSPELKDKVNKEGGNVKGAAVLGATLAEKCKEKGISKIVFDRSGYAYHGRVKALAEAMRKNGVQF
jgi:large subunit ribosomal protein L18